MAVGIPTSSPGAPPAENGRVGVSMRDAAGHWRDNTHADERFVMCSTFKFLAVAAVLHRLDVGEEKLDRFIPYAEKDLLEYAPRTRQHVKEGGMKLEDLCFAAIAYSDNTAANLVLSTIGGPSGVTAYARSLGDEVTRLDRTEPELNNTTPGDERDTTTARAMSRDMEKILLGDALSQTSREKLESWMSQNTTGHAMIRAGAPKDWKVADKTGSNRNSNTNDIAILRPPTGAPILLAIYLEQPESTPEHRARMIASLAAEWLPH